jgi:hypothetical protein
VWCRIVWLNSLISYKSTRQNIWTILNPQISNKAIIGTTQGRKPEKFDAVLLKGKSECAMRKVICDSGRRTALKVREPILFGTTRFDHGTVFSGLCKLIFPKELGLHCRKIALHDPSSFRNLKRNKRNTQTS